MCVYLCRIKTIALGRRPGESSLALLDSKHDVVIYVHGGMWLMVNAHLLIIN